MNNMTSETVKLKALVIDDKLAGVFTVALEGTGGPIVSAPTEVEARAKFEEALSLSCAVQNLIIFRDAVKNAEKETAEKGNITAPKKAEIEFELVELV